MAVAGAGSRSTRLGARAVVAAIAITLLVTALGAAVLVRGSTLILLRAIGLVRLRTALVGLSAGTRTRTRAALAVHRDGCNCGHQNNLAHDSK